MPYDLSFLRVHETKLGSALSPSGVVDGMDAVVQKIVKSLLSNPGEYQSNPAYGAGLSAALTPVAGQRLDEARQVVSRALQAVREDLRFPASEDQTLQRLALVDLVYDKDQTAWVITLEVETPAGTARFTTAVG
jgi:hypothetical protein